MAELFIVGVGRSGTSLLQSMLAAHPAIGMLPETGFFRRYCAAPRPGGTSAGNLTGVSGSAHGGAGSGAGSPGSRPGAALSVDSLRGQDERLGRLSEETWRAALSHVPERADEDVGRLTAAHRAAERRRLLALYRSLLLPEIAGIQVGRPAEQLSYTADKDPRLIEYLPLLKAAFPECRIIHIVRDPRDVLLSKMSAEWSRHRNWRANLAAGRFQLDLGDRACKELFGWRCHVVRYEDLISRPERTLRRLAHALDLDFHTDMLSFSGAAQRLQSSSEEAWKQETTGPLLAGNSGKWRSGLSNKQARVTEAVMQRHMLRYGYGHSGSAKRAAPFARLLYGTASLLYGLRRAGGIARAVREIDKAGRS